jgi:hypothetical protein
MKAARTWWLLMVVGRGSAFTIRITGAGGRAEAYQEFRELHENANWSGCRSRRHHKSPAIIASFEAFGQGREVTLLVISILDCADGQSSTGTK